MSGDEIIFGLLNNLFKIEIRISENFRKVDKLEKSHL